jgi:hypothetical protein
MRIFMGAAAAAVLGFGATSAGAVDYLFDNFNAETPQPPGSTSELNYNHFANFFVYDGTVDLVSAGGYGIDTGNGYFVDLDGSTMNGGTIETINHFNFSAGDRVRLSFDVSGNQRDTGGQDDNLFAGFRFFTPVTYSKVQLTGFDSIQTPAPILEGVKTLVPMTQPWTTYSISFTAQNAGTFSALIGTGSADNIGPLIDNVRVSAFVPEPSSWTLMILGMGAAGAMLRRHQRSSLRTT